MALRTSKTDLLIIGAGPAGLMAACWASKFDLSTRIIDQKGHRTETGHADGIHSRTLEILDSFGVADPILRRGMHEVEMCYWGVSKESGNLECQGRLRSQPEHLSRFSQMLLNQGEVEQVLIDHLDASGRVHVERNKRADKIHFADDDNDGYPVVVRAKSLRADRMENLRHPGSNGTFEVTEIIYARYVVACDGAHSTVREQLHVPVESKSSDSTWGVIDIVPITDFPDIRQSCAIHSEKSGSIMTAPREDRLVRFYIQVTGDTDLEKKALEQSEDSPKALIDIAQRIMQPYSLTYKKCDWWSLYPQYQVNNRVFFAGDAAHTHSPKAGQGMNVSIQDTYNLMWKLGSVITGVLDPVILDTYQLERHAVAEELIQMDSRLVHAYEEQKASLDDVSEIRKGYAGFMSGVEVTYPPNVLVASKQRCGDLACAKNIRLGMRLNTFPVLNQADGSTVQLANVLSSNAAWRLLVFSGDLRDRDQQERLATLADAFYRQPHLSRTYRTRPSKAQPGLVIEAILVHPSPQTSVKLLDLPEIFRPFDDTLGWDYWRVFSDSASDDDGGHAFKNYGIDKDTGCLVLCRPDQHVAWIGGLEDIARLDDFFGGFQTMAN